MPLPTPTVTRTRLHARSIELEGWKRSDGLWEIEARLVDKKDHDYALASGMRARGEAVHDMRLRVAIDREFNIVDAVASIDGAPYPGSCESIAAAYRKIIGLNLVRGFRRTVGEMFATVQGCSHLTELLAALPTVAIQTFASEVKETEGSDPAAMPFQVDRCHALDTRAETVRRYYPRWYRGDT